MGNQSILPVLCIALLLGTALAVIPGTVSKAEAQTTNLENAEITLLDPDKHLYRYTTLPAPKIISPEGYFENYYITDNSNSITFTSTAHEFEFHKNTCSFTVRDGDGNTEIGNMEQKFYINSGDRWQDITPKSCTVELTDSNKTHAKITASSDSRGIEFDVIFDIHYAGYVEWTYEITNNQRNIANPQLGIVEICTDCTSADNPFLNRDGTVSDPLAFRQAGLDDKARKGTGEPGKREYDHEAIGDKLLSVGAGVYDPKNDQHGTLSAIRLDNSNMEVEFFGTEALPFGQTMIIDPSFTIAIGGNAGFVRLNENPPAINGPYTYSPYGIWVRNGTWIISNTNERVHRDYVAYATISLDSIPRDVIIHDISLSFQVNYHTHLSNNPTLSIYPKTFDIPWSRPYTLTPDQTTALRQTLNGETYYSEAVSWRDGSTQTISFNNNAIRDLQSSIDNDDTPTFGIFAGLSPKQSYNNIIATNPVFHIDYTLIEHELVIDATSTPKYLGVESPANYDHTLGANWAVQDRAASTFKVGNQDTRTLAGGIQFDLSDIGDNWAIDDLAVGLQVLEKSDSTGNFEFAQGSIRMPDHTDWDGSSLSESEQTTLNTFTDKIMGNNVDYTPTGSVNTVTETGYHVFDLNDRAISDLEFSAARVTDTPAFAADTFRPNIRPVDSDTAWYMKINADPPAGGTGIKPKLHVNYTVPVVPTGTISNIQLDNASPLTASRTVFRYTWDYTGTTPERFRIQYTDGTTRTAGTTPDGNTFHFSFPGNYDQTGIRIRAEFSDGSSTDYVPFTHAALPSLEITITDAGPVPGQPPSINTVWNHNYVDYDISNLNFKLEYRPDGGSIISETIDDADTLSYVRTVLPETAYQVSVSFMVGTNILDTTGWTDVTSGSWPTITINPPPSNNIRAQSADITFDFVNYELLDRFTVRAYSGINQLFSTNILSTVRTVAIEPDNPFPPGTITVAVTPYASDGSKGSVGPTVEMEFDSLPIVKIPPETQIVDEENTVDYTMPVKNPHNQDIGWSFTSSPKDAAKINPETGRFTWTPAEDDGPGTYTFDISAAAATNTLEYELSVTVNEVNEDPIIQTNVDLNPLIKVGDLFTDDLDANDPDLPAQTISYKITSQDPTDNPAAINSTTGVITWTPTTAGTKTITILASDGPESGGTDDVTITITALPPLGSFTESNNGLDQTSTNVLGAEHVDAELRITKVTPSQANPDENYDTGHTDTHITFTPTSDHSSQYVFGYTASTQNNTYTDTGTLTVSVNMPPSFAPSYKIYKLTVGETLSEIPYREVIDDAFSGYETLTYSLSDDPPDDMEITSGTGHIEWTPTADDVGIDSFTLVASDGKLSGSMEIVITVVEPLELQDDSEETGTNTPIVIFPLGNDDPDARLSSVQEPANGESVMFGDAGVLYTPNKNYAGVDTFTYEVYHADDDDNTGTASITITVSEDYTNEAPRFQNVGKQKIAQLQTLNLDIVATDQDGSTIEYMLFDGPEGAAITPQGQFSWTPTEAHLGKYKPVVLAVDDDMAATKLKFTIKVSAP